MNKYREAAKLEINVLQQLHDKGSHEDKFVLFIALSLSLSLSLALSGVITNHFSGPANAIGPLRVCVRTGIFRVRSYSLVCILTFKFFIDTEHR